jgi:putative ABC transport system ATP-binding protein
MNPRIEARDLWRVYWEEGVQVDALRSVDLDVEVGEFLAVMGPSGSGKSTLLHLLGGLDVPSRGEVLVDGVALSSLSRGELARVRNQAIGFVFQTFNLFPALTVTENVALPAVIGGRRAARQRGRVAELLAAVGLTSKANRLPAQLSGGEQQRVAVARALVMEPAVLLADEPTGNLDSRSAADLMLLLRRCHEGGQTIVLVTHDTKVASHAERLVFMRDGRLAEQAEMPLGEPSPESMSRLVQLGNGEADRAVNS